MSYTQNPLGCLMYLGNGVLYEVGIGFSVCTVDLGKRCLLDEKTPNDGHRSAA